MANPRSRSLQADALLLLVTLIWGSTFLLVQKTVMLYPVFAFLSLRFVLASLVLLLLFGRRLGSLTPRMWLAGLATGFFLFAGYAFQTIGLQYTTSSKAGFITGLSVVIVPVLSATLLRRVPENRVLMGVVLSTIGLALLLLPESAGLLLRPGSAGLVTLGANLMPSRGDLIVLCCAVCFALHIVAVSRFAPRTDALALTIVQVAAVAVFSAISATLAGEWQQPPLPPVIGAAVFTGVLATALAFAVQNSVQVWTTATHTALIFASEPVFAGIFGYWLGGERLAGWGLVGSALILTGMLVAELRALPTWRTNPLGGDTT